MSILTKSSIVSALDQGDITIFPYNERQLNPNSYDLRLGKGIKLIKNWVSRCADGTYELAHHELAIDPKKPIETVDLSIDDRFLLEPGMFYLMHTEERVCSNQFVPVLDGKSSIARLGIKIHCTAGYGDIGFDGQYTLEVEVSGPVYVYSGMRIAQIRFHEIVGDITDYKTTGHYVGDKATGAVESRVYEQIREDKI